MTSNPNPMNRRQLLSAAALAGAALTLGHAPRLFGQDQGRKKILFFTKSSGFPHPVVTRNGKEFAHAERLLKEFGGQAGYDVTVTKDGSIFTPEKLKEFDAIAFYTTEDLTKNNNGPRHPKEDVGPTMPENGPQALLDFIASGKGFIGFHCASDTFHSPNYRGDKKINQQVNMLRDANAKLDDVRTPYIKMIGGEFVTHQSQQPATMKVVDNSFPGFDDLKDANFTEEWYSLANFSEDLHVLLVQDTESMKAKGETAYKRPSYPATWCKSYGQGRVFYTSMGHREDVWTSPFFQKVTLAGLAWITGKTQFDPKPNVAQATPEIVTFPAVKVG
jgi:type 1 glutamine amidotransferase